MVQFEINQGGRTGVKTADAQRIRELEWEYRELRRSNAILKTASAFFAAEPDRLQSKMIQFIDQYKDMFGVKPIYAELPITPATYSAAKTRAPSARS